jgi:two-component system KDP operon response regulator KdpE
MEIKSARILIVDDESSIRRTLKSGLEAQSFTTAEANNGTEGIQKVSEFHPHLVILDLGLPDMNGLEFLKQIRKWTQVPVIVLTVSDDEKTKVQLLESGADDYLTKPFGFAELLARIRVSLRHAGMIEATPTFQSDDLEVDLNQQVVKVSGEVVRLTRTEFELLSLLVRDQGKVVPQKQLLKQIWGAATEDQSHYLRIYINQLRKKIEKSPGEPVHIITEPGVGYRIV